MAPLRRRIRDGQYPAEVREDREAEGAKKHPVLFLLRFSATLTALQISVKMCPNSAKCTLLCVF